MHGRAQITIAHIVEVPTARTAATSPRYPDRCRMKAGSWNFPGADTTRPPPADLAQRVMAVVGGAAPCADLNGLGADELLYRGALRGFDDDVRMRTWPRSRHQGGGGYREDLLHASNTTRPARRGDVRHRAFPIPGPGDRAA